MLSRIWMNSMIMLLLLLLSLLIIHFYYIILIYWGTLRPNKIQSSKQEIKQLISSLVKQRNKFSLFFCQLLCSHIAQGVSLRRRKKMTSEESTSFWKEVRQRRSYLVTSTSPSGKLYSTATGPETSPLAWYSSLVFHALCRMVAFSLF